MVELTIKVPDEVKAWLDAKVEGGPFGSVEHALRYILRQQREIEEPGFIYSDEDIDDMISEARASGVVEPTPTVAEIMEAAMRKVEQRRQR